MTKFDSFLRNNDLEGTATNKYGEIVYLGKANTVRHTKYAYNISWDIPEVTSTSSLDRVILHNGSKVFGVLNMPLFRLDGHKKVQVTVK